MACADDDFGNAIVPIKPMMLAISCKIMLFSSPPIEKLAVMMARINVITNIVLTVDLVLANVRKPKSSETTDKIIPQIPIATE